MPHDFDQYMVEVTNSQPLHTIASCNRNESIGCTQLGTLSFRSRLEGSIFAFETSLSACLVQCSYVHPELVLGYLAGSTAQHRRRMENENNYGIVEYTKRQIGNHAVKREKRKRGRWRPFADAGNADSQ